MRRSLSLLAVIALLLLGIAIMGTGCGKKVTPVVPETPPTPAAEPTTPAAPAPTMTLSASPAAIANGESSTLTWRSTNASEVTIDGGIGTVEASGSRMVSPSTSTTYRARATGPGGSATAEARVTVSAAVVPPLTNTIESDPVWFPKNVSDVFFDYDSYEIGQEGQQSLLNDARALKERPSIRITIEGHCDERGSESYNLALGDRRANAARDFLVAQGIDPSRIDTISYGEEKPFATGHDESSWRQNRRAHFVMR